MKTAQYFVKKFNLYNICLVYLHDKRVFAEDKIFKSGINRYIFNSIEQVQIPLKSTSANIYKIYKINKIIANLFKNHTPKNIYLFGFDTIYNIIIKHGRRSGAKITLLEEGLSQYFLLDKSKISFSFQRLLDSIKSIFDIIKRKVHSYNIMYRFIILPFYLMLFFIKFCSIPDLHILIMRIFRIYPEFFEIKPHFDDAYLAFPEIAQKNISASNYYKINALEYKINFPYCSIKRVLFISQQYSTKKQYEKFYTCIFSILSNIVSINECIIDIKLHPRENKDMIIGILNNNNNSNIFILKNNYNNAEEILSSGEYSILMGITSSTLVYCMNYFNNIKVFSIGNELLCKLGSEAPIAMRQHINELNSCFNITQYRIDQPINTILYRNNKIIEDINND